MTFRLVHETRRQRTVNHTTIVKKSTKTKVTTMVQLLFSRTYCFFTTSETTGTDTVVFLTESSIVLRQSPFSVTFVESQKSISQFSYRYVLTTEDFLLMALYIFLSRLGRTRKDRTSIQDGSSSSPNLNFFDAQNGAAVEATISSSRKVGWYGCIV